VNANNDEWGTVCEDSLSCGFTKKMTQPQELDLAGEAMGCEKKECCI
jgi:hypothetical protein